MTTKTLIKVIWYALLALLILLMLAPIAWMISTSFKPETEIATIDVNWIPRNFTTENYERVFERFAILRWTLNSLIVSSAATALVLLLDSLAGYALARMHFAGRSVIFGIILSMLFVPMQITVVPLFLMFAEVDLTDTYLALVLPVGANVTGVFLMRQFFLNIPYELEDAARVDGASTLRIWWSVVLPLMRSGLAVATIFTFVGMWGNFFVPFMLLLSPENLPAAVTLYTFSSQYGQVAYGQLAAFSIFYSLPVVALYLFLGRSLGQGFAAAGGVKG